MVNDFRSQLFLSANSTFYLGSLISSNGRDDQEINTRIGMAWSAFNNMERVLRDGKMEVRLQLQILMRYVWSVARYALETWTLSKTAQKKIEVFEMWCNRRVHRIKWTEDKISNRIVLQRTGLQQTILEVFAGEAGEWRDVQNRSTREDYGEAPRGRGRNQLTLLHGIENR